MDIATSIVVHLLFICIWTYIFFDARRREAPIWQIVAASFIALDVFMIAWGGYLLYIT